MFRQLFKLYTNIYLCTQAPFEVQLKRHNLLDEDENNSVCDSDDCYLPLLIDAGLQSLNLK